MKALIISLFMILGFSSIAQKNTIKEYRWNYRILLVNTVNGNHLFDHQKTELLKDEEGLKERRILVLKSSDYKLTKSINRKLNNTGILLIGLDGGIKDQREKAYSIDELYTIIDGMPMRRSEIRASGG